MKWVKIGTLILKVQKKLSDKYTYSAEVKSRSEDSSKHVRTSKILQVAPTHKYTNKQFVVDKIVKAEKIEERREQIVFHCTQYHMFESVVQNVNKSFVG